MTVTRLTGVYHAKGSLTGEFAYVVGKALGTAHCALCDITHGRLRQKAAWRECRDALPVPFEAVHLDERSPEVRLATEGRTPCVVAHTPEGIEMLVDADELERCAADPQRLATLIRERLDPRPGA
jgi:hypothetical protein